MRHETRLNFLLALILVLLVTGVMAVITFFTRGL